MLQDRLGHVFVNGTVLFFVHIQTNGKEFVLADSLDQVELVMALEEAFGAEIPDEDAEKLTTVGDAIAYVESKQNKG